jgi:hypothetical protein
MTKENFADVVMNSEGPLREPITVWVSETHKTMYQWLRDVRNVKSAVEFKKGGIPRIEALAKRFGFPGPNAA